MNHLVRLGAVSYLNARPLVHGLAADENVGRTFRSAETSADAADLKVGPTTPGFSLRFDVPAVCAQLLAQGQIDLGLVPTITYLDRPGDRVVPNIAIASDGPVASVAIFTRRDIRSIRTLALDVSSKTSIALTRILCARLFKIAPAFLNEPPDLAGMLGVADAALLIGDPALFADHRSLGAEKIDLGQSWTDLTGLPFVWAFWAGPETAADSTVVRRLQQIRDDGVAHSDDIANAYSSDHAKQAVGRRYLRENIRYDLPPRALEGLRKYFEFAAELGLVTRTGPIEFF